MKMNMDERNKIPLFYYHDEYRICYMNYKHQVYESKASTFNFDLIKRYDIIEYPTYDGHFIFYSPLLSIINSDIIRDCMYNAINVNTHYYMGKYFHEEVFGQKLLNIMHDKDITVIKRYIAEELRHNSKVLYETLLQMNNAFNINNFLKIFVGNLQNIISRKFVMKVYELSPMDSDKKVKYYKETDLVKYMLEDAEDFKITRVKADIVYSGDKLSIEYITVSIDLCESSKEKTIAIVKNNSKYLLDRALEACEDPHYKGYVKQTKLPLSALQFDNAIVTNDCRFVVTLSTKKELK